MKKVSTAAAKARRNVSQQTLTVGLDLGDRNSWYCVLDEAGQIQLEQRARTSAKALREVFGAMPRSRLALETGTHSPWISRLLSELGHEVIVANARKVRLIGESRKKDDRLDARTLARLARSAAHPGAVRRGLRSPALGTEAGGAWWEKRQEAGPRGDRPKTGSVAASPVGERRSVRAIAQQPPNGSGGSRIKQKTKPTSKSFPERKIKVQSRVPGAALIAGPTFCAYVKRQVANQIAAPAATRTPNLHRAKRSLLESANGSMASAATRREKRLVQQKTQELT